MSAIVFDMDGVLIDSEPLWKEAEIEIFGALGVPLTLPMTDETTGLGIEPVSRLWFSRYPWAGESPASVAARVKRRVAQLISDRGRPVPGACELVRDLRAAGARLALCTSSSPALIETVLEALELVGCFEVLQSAEACTRGKPAPDPYLATARALGLSPRECLVIEDSLNGARSARAAGCVVVGLMASPAPGAREVCDLVVSSFAELSPARLLALLEARADGVSAV